MTWSTDGAPKAQPGVGRNGLRLGQDLGEIARLNAWFEDVAQALGLPQATAADVKLCLDEAATNAISYGFEGRSDGSVEIEIAREGASLRVRLSDDGTPFDPLAAPLPAPPADIASAAIGGLGITLIRQTASRAAYERQGGRNVLTLHFDPPV